MSPKEMHVWFRQYAQQMGMQTVRGILPEQIDILINTSISDYTNQLIAAHISLTNDRGIIDNSKLGQVNALRALYKVTTLTLAPQVATPVEDDADGLVKIAKFIKVGDNGSTFDPMHLVSLAVNYTKGDKTTSLFPVSIIDDRYLANTLNDNTLAPRVEAPIAVIYGGVLDLYFGKEYAKGNKRLNSDSLVPKTLRVSYLEYPNKVKYTGVDATDVACNLPASTHVDILKHAVDLYTISVRGNLYNAQQQAQNQEQQRSQARPENND